MSGLFQQNWKLLGGLLIVLLVLGVTASWLVGGYLCSPWNRSVKLPENLSVEKVTFPSESGSTIHGWISGSAANRAVVILQHGIRADKSSLVERARFLTAAGYAVLLYDFQAHGESAGSRTTFGYLESRDARAAFEFVRHRFPDKPIGVIGLSLGAAAAVMAQPPIAAQALVLEMMYPNVVDATKDRIERRLGTLGRSLSPLLTCQLKLRIGCSVSDLCPLRFVETLATPKLFLAGTEDRDTKIEESREMYARAAEPKLFVPFEGARHEDLLIFAPERYKKNNFGFSGDTFEMKQTPFEPKGIIFDCDGTLADTMPLHWRAWQQMITQRHNLYFPQDRFYAFGGVPSRDILKQLAQEQGRALDHTRRGAHEKEESVSAVAG